MEDGANEVQEFMEPQGGSFRMQTPPGKNGEPPIISPPIPWNATGDQASKICQDAGINIELVIVGDAADL